MATAPKLTGDAKFSTARLFACREFPYLSSAILALIPIEAAIETLAVSERGHLFWSRAWVDAMETPRVAAGIVHEVWHILRGHFARGRRLRITPDDQPDWNLCEDAEINDDLLGAVGAHQKRLDCGADWIYPKTIGQPDGRTAEEYWFEVRKRQRSKAGGLGLVGQGRCGSGAGHPVENEPRPGTAGVPPGRTSQDLERIRRQVAKDIASAKGAGNVPGEWRMWADKLNEPPVVPWETELMHYGRSELGRRKGIQNFSYGRWSRRQAAIGDAVILPGMTGLDARVSVALDVSGSMSGRPIGEALRELDGLFRAIGAQVTFYAVDCAVSVVKKIRNWKEAAACFTGGGTDFSPAIEAMGKARPRPDLAIYLTDGYGSAPVTPPGYPLVWLLCGENPAVPTTENGPVSYGRIIRLERPKRIEAPKENSDGSDDEQD